MSQQPPRSNKKMLGIFTLAIINVAAIVSLRNLPLAAEYGLASIFFYGVAGVALFVPISLVAAELATLMYALVFATAIRLRHKHPEIERPYQVPGGMAGMRVLAGLGLLAVLFTLSIGFVPPSTVDTGDVTFFVLFLVIGLIVMSDPPSILERVKRPGWTRETATGLG